MRCFDKRAVTRILDHLLAGARASPCDSRLSQGDDQYPVPPAEMTWMQCLCDQVRERIGPLPLAIKKLPHSYMPFLHEMLKDLEACILLREVFCAGLQIL